jgi:hypothetical protein
MMVGTTEFGTARLGFHDKRTGGRSLPGVAVAGKTGSLDRKTPYALYSWFVGFAPADEAGSRRRRAARQRATTGASRRQVARELVGSWLGQSASPAASQLAAR